MQNFTSEMMKDIHTLVNSEAGVCSFELIRSQGHQPLGELEDCNADVEGATIKWVDQTTNGGDSGREFAGTVTWLLGCHYLIAHYHTRGN